MGSVATFLPQNFGGDPRDLLEVVGLPSDVEHAPKQLSVTANDLLRSVVSLIDDLVLRTLKERTKEDFEKRRTEVFAQYFKAMVSLGVLIRIAVPKKDVVRLTAESLSKLEADFKEHGAATFGSKLADRGIFTVWILRKINDLAQEIQTSPISVAISDEKKESVAQFAASALCARFHIDCLIKSINSGVPIFPEVVDSIEDGLRAVVNAYAWIRQLVVFRTEDPKVEWLPIQWDAEDEALLKDSMRNLADEDF